MKQCNSAISAIVAIATFLTGQTFGTEAPSVRFLKAIGNDELPSNLWSNNAVTFQFCEKEKTDAGDTYCGCVVTFGHSENHGHPQVIVIAEKCSIKQGTDEYFFVGVRYFWHGGLLTVPTSDSGSLTVDATSNPVSCKLIGPCMSEPLQLPVR